MNPNSCTRAIAGGASHRGAVRQRNEDAWYASTEINLWLVADGVGGAAAGDVASAIAVEIISHQVASGMALKAAIEAAHEAIVAAPSAGRGAAGMGSTIVALNISGTDFEIAWVGDSRAYLLAAGELELLSHDHSLVQNLVDSGEIESATARFHPRRNVVTRALGGLTRPAPTVDRTEGVLKKGHRFLLCSDGLNDELDDPAIREILVREMDPERTAKRLVAAAVAAGGNDNVTAVVVDIPA